MKEPANIVNPEYSVDRIVARMKESATRQGQVSDSASVDVVTSAEFRPSLGRGRKPLGEIRTHPLKLQPAFQPHSDGRYHVDDLLKYHDRDFIQNAYRAILKRGPDATGYTAFIESLRSGQLNKIDILARLRYSAEGRAKQVEIEGLQVPAMIRKAYRVPVVGYLLNLSVALARLPLMIRNEQQFSAHVLAQQEIVVEHLNRIDRTLHAHAEEVSQTLEVLSESGKQLADDLREQASQTREHVDQGQRHAQQQLDELTVETRQQANLIGRQQTAMRQDLSERLADQTRDVEGRLGSLADLAELRRGELAQQLATQLQNETAQREHEVLEVGKQIGQATARWQEHFESFETHLRLWRQELKETETQLQEAALTQREQIELTSKDLKQEIERVFQRQQEVSRELVLQGERLATLLLEARRRLPKPFDKTQLEIIAREEDHTLDAFYASFDEQFRGSRDEIKRRLGIYLPIIKDRGIGTATMPLLDVGCGRGEWLELLKEEQLSARGVDSNRVLIEWCRNRDLDVAEEDLITCLHRQPDASLGAVSGFHIIEHLPIETLVEFLNQTVRVLKPGGVVIFETPNPQNVLVGSCNFYFDPTHRNPLPSQVTKFLLESRGFVGVEVLNLNPSDDTPVEENSDLARRFNKYFYGPMDYAVVGIRP